MRNSIQKFPDLAAYLKRVGFAGAARPDLATLRELQRVHVRTVPFENIDVQLRCGVELNLEASFDKIVRRRRGGWCYELNGVFGWALQAIGFEVMRVSAGVAREQSGDAQMGNHLCLLVKLDQSYFIDVGFGGSLLHPLPLQPIVRDDSPYRIALNNISDGYWRFSEQANGEPFSFDFRTDKANEVLLADKCAMLQTSADSPFVQNLVVQRRTDNAHLSLRGRVLTTLDASGEKKNKLKSANELVCTLRDEFDLDAPEAATLWPAICARHETLFGSSVAHGDS